MPLSLPVSLHCHCSPNDDGDDDEGGGDDDDDDAVVEHEAVQQQQHPCPTDFGPPLASHRHCPTSSLFGMFGFSRLREEGRR